MASGESAPYGDDYTLTGDWIETKVKFKKIRKTSQTYDSARSLMISVEIQTCSLKVLQALTVEFEGRKMMRART